MIHKICRTVTHAREQRPIEEEARIALQDATANTSEWFLYTTHRYDTEGLYALVKRSAGTLSQDITGLANEQWYWFSHEELEFLVFLEFWQGNQAGDLTQLDQFFNRM